LLQADPSPKEQNQKVVHKIVKYGMREVFEATGLPCHTEGRKGISICRLRWDQLACHAIQKEEGE
jgi:hypothetical protein